MIGGVRLAPVCGEAAMKAATKAATTQVLTVLLAGPFAPHARAQAVDGQRTWEATLAAAKREGKVVIVGTPKPTMRNEIAPKFTARYGIPVEFIAGKSEEMVERVRIERASG